MRCARAVATKTGNLTIELWHNCLKIYDNGQLSTILFPFSHLFSCARACDGYYSIKMCSPEAKLNMHKAQCSVCKSPYCTEIEDRYIMGESERTIAKDYPSLSASAILRHVTAYQLQNRRRVNTLAQVQRLLQNVDLRHFRLQDERSIIKCLELQAKLTGELIERRQNDNKTEVDISERLETQMANLTAAIGGVAAPKGTNGNGSLNKNKRISE